MKPSLLILTAAAWPLLVAARPAETNDLREIIRARSVASLTDAALAEREAAVRAQEEDFFQFELRPRVTDQQAGLAFRIYLPAPESKQLLRERLFLESQAERLRIEALEWNELIAVYRDFCEYRYQRDRRTLYQKELDALRPWIAEADAAVASNQLSVLDRARFQGQYLKLLNERDRADEAFEAVRDRLLLHLGSDADLDRLAEAARLSLPEASLQQLLDRALAARPDYLRLGVEARARETAARRARRENGFRLRFIQPSYDVDYTGDDDDRWSLSAAFTLPWGRRPVEETAAVEQRNYLLAQQDFLRRLILDRLLSLTRRAEALRQRTAEREKTVAPLLKTLQADIDTLSDAPLPIRRNLLALRERLLETRLQNLDDQRKAELLAVDFAEETASLFEEGSSTSEKSEKQPSTD